LLGFVGFQFVSKSLSNGGLAKADLGAQVNRASFWDRWYSILALASLCWLEYQR
jgi:hypothetical protein